MGVRERTREKENVEWEREGVRRGGACPTRGGRENACEGESMREREKDCGVLNENEPETTNECLCV